MSKQVYWISRRDQVEALINPTRHDIVDRLTALGPLSVRALADALGRRPTAIYQHLTKMEKLGLVRVSRIEGQRGRPATIYEAVAPLVRLARAPRSPANRRPMSKVARSVAARAAKDYATAFKTDNWSLEGVSRNQWFFRLFSAPSPQKLARINVLLDELMNLVRKPDPNPGRLISVAWFMSPIEPKLKRRRR